MPIYQYSHPKTGEIANVFQGMNDKHEFFRDGVKWNRVFTVPQASIDTQIDAMSQKDFVEKTGKKRGKLGDMFDASREASDKRKQIMGHDPVKKKYWDDYAAKRKGKRHPKSFED